MADMNRCASLDGIGFLFFRGHAGLDAAALPLRLQVAVCPLHFHEHICLPARDVRVRECVRRGSMVVVSYVTVGLREIADRGERVLETVVPLRMSC